MTFRSRILTTALLGVWFCGVAWAQSPQVQVTGIVRDATGAGVPGVTITGTHRQTNVSRSATTAADGTYTLALDPGSYTVTAAVPGFRKVSQTVEVAGASRQVDFTLQAQLSEEVTVTALKRESTVLDVPFSVAAPTEQVLRDRGVEDIEGVAANVGGFTVQNLGPGQSQVAMRGVSAGQIVRDQPGVKEQVGTFLDESVISLSLFTPDLELFDTKRIEVLRGPQGTLFGAGSLSGTVRYISNQPTLGVTEGTVELGASAVHGGGFGASTKAAVNVPLGETAALRVVGYYTRLPGYMDAVQPDLSVQENVNDGFRTGTRTAVKFAPNERFSITPRLVYQKVEMDGWNRIDEFNILANPFTTTRPAVTLGGRRQFIQLEEKFTDDFVLGDVNLNYDFGAGILTSITSYIYRDVLVVRDATALTGSITGGSIGLPENVYTLDGPLFDATTAKTWTQELRFSRGQGRFPWVAGLFYSRQDRDYAQDLRVAGFEDLTGISTRGLLAPVDSLFWSDLGYKLNQLALFGEGTLDLNNGVRITAGVRFYHFNEDKEQIFDGLFANDNTGTALVSQPGSTDASGFAPRLIATYQLPGNANLNAQVSRGFRLGGINDPLNVPLCTAQDLTTFGGRETWDDESVWNYEVGYKSRVLNGNGAFNVAAYYADIRDLQATVTAGSCSSRVVFNVPKARSQGIEVEFEAAPNQHVDFAISGSFTDPELRSTLTSTDLTGGVSVVSGIEEGRRLPSVPRVQLAAALTLQREITPGALGFVTGTFQHLGSRFTQVGDDELGTLDLLSFGDNTIGGPLTQSTLRYVTRLPAYDMVNLRVGLRRAAWEAAFYINNITDELALLSLDRERGTRARIGYLTNQPRTFGLTYRVTF
ncbi:MAG TPA: TonB-dependent receptor [Vicinamibacterales bacterium]|nr:TonB-dependent receptor [Vicinamibacterales bacterium]